MKELVLFIAAIALSACSTSPVSSLPSLCGSGTPEQWHLASAPPPGADHLVALADASPNFPAGRLDYPVEQWFWANAGKQMLCREEKRSCMGEWWQFEITGGRPLIVRQDAWVCVTGVWPNNSFKSMPLRGMA
jgi:hypothetical protein